MGIAWLISPYFEYQPLTAGPSCADLSVQPLELASPQNSLNTRAPDSPELRTLCSHTDAHLKGCSGIVQGSGLSLFKYVMSGKWVPVLFGLRVRTKNSVHRKCVPPTSSILRATAASPATPALTFRTLRFTPHARFPIPGH